MADAPPRPESLESSGLDEKLSRTVAMLIGLPGVCWRESSLRSMLEVGLGVELEAARLLDLVGFKLVLARGGGLLLLLYFEASRSGEVVVGDHLGVVRPPRSSAICPGTSGVASCRA